MRGNRNIAPAWLVTLALMGGATPVWADALVAKAKGCLNCHAIETRVIGPSFRDVAKKYEADRSAAERLPLRIRGGSAGIWGAIPMPANPGVSPQEAAALAAWIRAPR